MIEWKDEYKVGIHKIDEQHKKLFDIAYEGQVLFYLPEHTDKYDEIIHIIEELRKYTKNHFVYEEKIMREIAYSKLFSHTVDHQDFIEKIYQIDLEEVDSRQNNYLLEILEFIVSWILEHIREKDTSWVNEYRQKKIFNSIDN